MNSLFSHAGSSREQLIFLCLDSTSPHSRSHGGVFTSLMCRPRTADLKRATSIFHTEFCGVAWSLYFSPSAS